MSEFNSCQRLKSIPMLKKFRNRLENLLAQEDTAESVEQSKAAMFAATALLY